MTLGKPKPAGGFGLAELMEAEGYGSLEELARDAIMEVRSPGICTECGYTTEMEPDQQAGWCECCETNTVKAGLILAGMI